MKKLLISTLLALSLALTIPLAEAGDSKFSAVAPRAEHGKRHYDRGYNRHDNRYANQRNQHNNRVRNPNYRYGQRYGTSRDYARYGYATNPGYIYRPIPLRYLQRYRYDSHYHHYQRNGIRVSPYGLTIFIGLGD